MSTQLKSKVIRLAASFPKGSAERTALLGLLAAGRPEYDLSTPDDADTPKGARAWALFCKNYILGAAPEPGPERDRLIKMTTKNMSYAWTLAGKRAVSKLYPDLIEGIKELKDVVANA